jgi:hypothetical protein
MHGHISVGIQRGLLLIVVVVVVVIVLETRGTSRL